MANEQTIVFIDLTQVFERYKDVGHWYQLYRSMKLEMSSKEITINVDTIARLEDADKSIFSPSSATHVILKTGACVDVQETRTEIKEKIGNALKP